MKIIFIALLVTAASKFSYAQDATAIRKEQFNLENGVALTGYDPVSYFTEQKAVKGRKEWSVFVQGVIYYFSSVSNKETFKADPAKYEPQYGGWCAYAMGKDGSKVEIDPETFKIINGKLYLYYNRLFNNTLKSWNKDEPNLKAKADQNWKKFFHS